MRTEGALHAGGGSKVYRHDLVRTRANRADHSGSGGTTYNGSPVGFPTVSIPPDLAWQPSRWSLTMPTACMSA